MMFVVYDKTMRMVMRDQYGHFKVYATKHAAQRRAANENSHAGGRSTRYCARQVTLRFNTPTTGPTPALAKRQAD